MDRLADLISRIRCLLDQGQLARLLRRPGGLGILCVATTMLATTATTKAADTLLEQPASSSESPPPDRATVMPHRPPPPARAMPHARPGTKTTDRPSFHHATSDAAAR